MFQLRITSGPHAGQVLQLTSAQTYVVGRGADAHLSIPEDKTLSRAHAELAPQGEQWLLRNKSQHGSLLGGQVLHGEQVLSPGAEFQVGETRVVFEAAPAGAAPAGGAPGGAPAGAGAPAGGAPAGGGGAPAGGAGAGGGAPAGAAAAGAGKALGGAAAALGGGGGVKIEHSGPGLPFGDLIKGAIGVVKSNLIPSLAVGFFFFVNYGISLAMQILVQVDMTGVVRILSLVSLGWTLVTLVAGPQLVMNYMAGIKEFQNNGTPISIGSLLKPTNLIHRYITFYLNAVGFACCCIPGLILWMSVPIIVDKPDAGFVNALKGALQWGKGNIVPLLIMWLIAVVFNIAGGILCYVGLMIAYPAMFAMVYLAYEVKKDEIATAAAEGGVQL